MKVRRTQESTDLAKRQHAASDRPARPAGARRANSDSRMPCQDIAVALNTPLTTPIVTVDHASVNAPVSTTLAAIPNASHAITVRGAT